MSGWVKEGAKRVAQDWFSADGLILLRHFATHAKPGTCGYDYGCCCHVEVRDPDEGWWWFGMLYQPDASVGKRCKVLRQSSCCFATYSC
jgi:hypothetical protein